ncbi:MULTISPECIES: ComEC/Rec2 family competence protein [Hyphomicrobiales]|jgi:ComEC/Rec2-related protein|uniref:ComEC/Rec2 family competence protein n=1 Tax=Hyphomicrobiales TaxID=356 RepID=UPI00058FC5DF|nr:MULTISPECIES: ComEC/Rec2 family competence protein [Phyllobacteriaceae]MCX8569394.1 ComEC family competence protein [Aminobacter sp. MET-1]
MGDRVREGQAGESPAVEVSERDLLNRPAALPTLIPAPERLPDAPGNAAEATAPTLFGDVSDRLWLAGSDLARRLRTARVQLAVEAELERGAAFMLVPVFLALGALIYFNLRNEPELLPLVAAFGLMLALCVLARSRRIVHLGLAAWACMALGLVAAKVETMRMATKMLGAEVSTTLSGRVVDIDHLDKGRLRLTIDVATTARPRLRFAPDRVRLVARQAPEGLVAGSTVQGYARLMPPSGPVRPGSYDFSFESYFDGIGASGFFMKGPDLAASTTEQTPTQSMLAWVANARDRVAERIRQRIGGAEGEIAAALVVGVRGGIPEDVNEALRRTGLYHIISISGLHMAMVAGTVMFLMRLGFAAFPDFASRHPVKKYAAVVALVGIAAYLFISGGEVAAQRSFVMLAVMLTAVLFDRAALTMRNLAISAIIVILVSPHEVVGPSFQMSFAATAALVGAYGWWSERREEQAQPVGEMTLWSRAWHWGRNATVGLVATSIIAGVATAVFGAWHFQRVSPLSLVANLAVMPVVSVLVMPFAVFASLAMPFGLDGPFLDVMGAGLRVMIAMAEWISDRSPLDAVGLVSTWSVVLVTIALVVAATATTWLRLAAVPFVVAGVLVIGVAPSPDVLVAEDGRLVGVATDDGKLAVNRPRPNQFTSDNWMRALAVEELSKPSQDAEKTRGTAAPAADGPRFGAAPQSLPANGRAKGLAPAEDAVKTVAGASAFHCSAGLCTLRHQSGATVVHASNAAAAWQVCRTAALVVIDDATAGDVCGGQVATVVTKRDLARLGSAAVYLTPVVAGGASVLSVEYAITEPYRPWHAHRQFSREARGLAPNRQEAVRKQPDNATTE